jgi:hypothetical protein
LGFSFLRLFFPKPYHSTVLLYEPLLSCTGFLAVLVLEVVRYGTFHC